MSKQSNRSASLKRAAQVFTLALIGLAGTAGAQNFPFGGHRQAYPSSTLRVSAGQSSADTATANFYRQWKSRYLVRGCQSDEYRVAANTSTAYVVSEGQGYGMLITVMMAGNDPEARTLFDGLHRYNRRHPSGMNPDLLAWAQDRSCNNVAGADSATDGDLDIAYALLLAHKQWGSGGSINYSAEADRVLRAIARSNVNPTTRLVNLGDWAGATDYSTRSSDWMVGHFRGFIGRPGTDWSQVLSKHQTIIETMQNTYANATGLLPDFIVNTQGTPRPAPPNFLESPNDGAYYYNACRVPLRIGIDAAITGDTRSRNAARRISAWIRGKAGNNPNNIRAGYSLSGNALESYSDLAFTAPFAAAAAVENQAWLDTMWTNIVNTGPDNYYADSIKMMTMLSVSQNWLTP